MLPAFFAAVADRLFARRWWFVAMSVLGMALAFAALSLSSPRVAGVLVALVGPLIFVPWALLCTCIWFHPQRGNLQPSSKVVGRLPLLVQTGLRWYAAVFLSLFLVFGAVVWPAVLVAWL
ncbi:hypothetical protein [Pelomonas sp. KK5]|uniref:hypothetical protein n=1 Tax=Pelomonas sp. KK5 TaxID=1855730 RepID=UPI00097BE064|nr:hypothetical protein [Pelomonas sp. KK5]